MVFLKKLIYNQNPFHHLSLPASSRQALKEMPVTHSGIGAVRLSGRDKRGEVNRQGFYGLHIL